MKIQKKNRTSGMTTEQLDRFYSEGGLIDVVGKWADENPWNTNIPQSFWRTTRGMRLLDRLVEEDTMLCHE
jgi:hypothetical protein